MTTTAAERPLRILLLSNLYPPDYDGGYELNAWKLANSLRSRGHEVEVLTSRFRPTYRGDQSEGNWVHRTLERRHMEPPNWPDPWRRLQAWWNLVYIESVAWRNIPRVREFLRGRCFDLGYVFGLQGVGLTAAWALQEAGLPALWHFGDHSVADQRLRYGLSRLYRTTGRTLLGSVKNREEQIRFEHCAFVSRFLEDYYAENGLVAANSYVLPRGVEFELGADVGRTRSDPPTFLLASRLVEDKGHHMAIEAAGLLTKRRPELTWRMNVVGTGALDYENRLKEMVAAEPALAARVEFLGALPRPEVLRLMREATAFISASIWGEPFANTIIETLGSGTPLIVSETGSALEVVKNGESALTYRKDSPEMLSDAMERLLTKPELGRRIASGGIARIKEAYTMDRILDQTEAIMRQVAHGSSAWPTPGTKTRSAKDPLPGRAMG